MSQGVTQSRPANRIPLFVAVAVLIGGALVYRLSHRNAGYAGEIAAATTLAKQGRVDDAIAALQDVLRSDPGNVEALSDLSVFYTVTHRDALAVDPLRKLAEIDPTTHDLFPSLVTSLQKSGQAQQALDQARADIQQHPDDVAALALAASLMAAEGDEGQEQMGYATRLVKLQPHCPDFLALLVHAQVDGALFADAAPGADALVNIDPGRPEAYLLRGETRYYTQPTPEGLAGAEADLRKAIQGMPNPFAAHLYLGKVLTKLNRPAEAVEELEPLLNSPRNDGIAAYALAEAYRAEGRAKDAAAAQSKAASQRSRFEAVTALEKRCALGHPDFDSLLELAQLKMESRELSDASYCLRRANEIHPRDGRLLALAATLRQSALASHQGER